MAGQTVRPTHRGPRQLLVLNGTPCALRRQRRHGPQGQSVAFGSFETVCKGQTLCSNIEELAVDAVWTGLLVASSGPFGPFVTVCFVRTPSGTSEIFSWFKVDHRLSARKPPTERAAFTHFEFSVFSLHTARCITGQDIPHQQKAPRSSSLLDRSKACAAGPSTAQSVRATVRPQSPAPGWPVSTQ